MNISPRLQPKGGRVFLENYGKKLSTKTRLSRVHLVLKLSLFLLSHVNSPWSSSFDNLLLLCESWGPMGLTASWTYSFNCHLPTGADAYPLCVLWATTSVSICTNKSRNWKAFAFHGQPWKKV